MFRIKTLNKIARVGLDQLDKMQDYEFPEALRALPGPGLEPTTFRWTGAARRALWCSTPPAPTPTR